MRLADDPRRNRRVVQVAPQNHSIQIRRRLGDARVDGDPVAGRQHCAGKRQAQAPRAAGNQNAFRHAPVPAGRTRPI